MENNNKTIRIVARAGRQRFAWVYEDACGDVCSILEEEIDMGFNSEAQFKILKECLCESLKNPILHINACNSDLYQHC